MKCLACNKPITARIQVGHELEQPVSFPCPHCGTPVQLTLILDEPPQVKIRWDENAEAGKEEGVIINIGAGFTIPQNKLHEDFYFPSFEAPRPNIEEYDIPHDFSGPILIDTSVALGTLPYAEKKWRLLERGLRFQRTNQQDNLNSQLDEFWGTPRTANMNLENAFYNFILRFLEPNTQVWLSSLERALQAASSTNSHEYSKLVLHYDSDLKAERFDAYSEIFSEYFKAYGEFSQTLVYVRRELAMPPNAIAASSDFERTRMFYGNAFEVLVAHLDVPAALNNIISGRPFDQMDAMNLKQFRTINKANRTNCFSHNVELSWLVTEYDSTVRNASHHRWFKLDNARQNISYRSGGTGAEHHMSYAEYLMRCNRLLIQIMMLACLELVLLSTSGKDLS